VAEKKGDEVLSVVSSQSLIMHIASTDGIPDGEKGKSHGQTVFPALLSSCLGVLGWKKQSDHGENLRPDALRRQSVHSAIQGRPCASGTLGLV
jgi:hypothetical protein